MFKFILLTLLLTACGEKGPKDIGHDLGVLKCKMAKTKLKVTAGANEKVKKAAAKDLIDLTKEHQKMTAKIDKMDKKSKKIAFGEYEEFMGICRR